MKDFIKVFGFITFSVIILFLMTGCDTDTDTDIDSDPTITINGIPKVGEKITAISKGNEFFGDFEWGYADEIDYNILLNNIIYNGLSGVNNSILTISAELKGKYIVAMRATSTEGGSISNILGPIQP